MPTKILEILLALFPVILEKGMPAVQKWLEGLNKPEVTLADIEALRITKEPEEY